MWLLSVVPPSKQLSSKSSNWARKKKSVGSPVYKARKENIFLPVSLQSDGWRTEGYLSEYHEQSEEWVWFDNRLGHFWFVKCSVLQGRRVLSGGKGEISVSEGKEIWDRVLPA